jgi:hypothetical protein
MSEKTNKIAEVQAFERDGTSETVIVDPGGTANVTADHCGPPGDDSPPLPGDFAQLSAATGKGRAAAVGYTDPQNERQAVGGEKRFYARNSDGEIVSTFWQKGDGSLVFENLNGWGFSMTADGVFTFDGSEFRITDDSGQPLARVGDLVSVVIPPLANSGGPVAPGGAGFPLAAAGQIVSGKANAKG